MALFSKLFGRKKDENDSMIDGYNKMAQRIKDNLEEQEKKLSESDGKHAERIEPRLLYAKDARKQLEKLKEEELQKKEAQEFQAMSRREQIEIIYTRLGWDPSLPANQKKIDEQLKKERAEWRKLDPETKAKKVLKREAGPEYDFGKDVLGYGPVLAIKLSSMNIRYEKKLPGLNEIETRNAIKKFIELQNKICCRSNNFHLEDGKFKVLEDGDKLGSEIEEVKRKIKIAGIADNLEAQAQYQAQYDKIIKDFEKETLDLMKKRDEVLIEIREISSNKSWNNFEELIEEQDRYLYELCEEEQKEQCVKEMKKQYQHIFEIIDRENEIVSNRPPRDGHTTDGIADQCKKEELKKEEKQQENPKEEKIFGRDYGVGSSLYEDTPYADWMEAAIKEEYRATQRIAGQCKSEGIADTKATHAEEGAIDEYTRAQNVEQNKNGANR